MSLSYCIVKSRDVTYGYFFKFSGVANLPNGFITTSYLICENNVDDTLHGIFPYLIAFYFCY